jgi:hypothetical protein
MAMPTIAGQQSRQPERSHEHRDREYRGCTRAITGDKMRDKDDKIACDVRREQTAQPEKADGIHSPRQR